MRFKKNNMSRRSLKKFRDRIVKNFWHSPFFYIGGFTIIEILVVITVIGILAVGVLVFIDPVEKVNSANDTKVIQDVSVLGRASEYYATDNAGLYPRAIADLLASGNVKTEPVLPSGYASYIFQVPIGCIVRGDPSCTSVAILGQLKSKKYNNSGYFYQRYESTNNNFCQVSVTTTDCSNPLVTTPTPTTIPPTDTPPVPTNTPTPLPPTATPTSTPIPTPTPTPSPWLAGYGFRKPITISNSGSTLSNYFILLSLDTASLISAGKMQGGCADIRFTDSDATTVLNYFFDYNCNNTNTKIWVSVPSVPIGNKTVYFYYGNGLATSASSVTALFGSGVITLYTFMEGSGTTLKDKVGSLNLTLTGLTWTTSFRSNLYALTGWTGGGRATISSNGPTIGTGSFTALAFIKPNNTSGGGTQGIVGNYFDDSTNGWVLKLQGSSQFMLLTNQAGVGYCQSGTGTLSNGIWSQVGGKRAAGIGNNLYQNGANILSLCAGDSRNISNSGPFDVGKSYNGAYPFDGSLSLIAVYNVTLADSTITSLYNSVRVSVEPTTSTGTEQIP